MNKTFHFVLSTVNQIKTNTFNTVHNTKPNHNCIHQNYLIDRLWSILLEYQKYMVYRRNVYRKNPGIRTKVMYFRILSARESILALTN